MPNLLVSRSPGHNQEHIRPAYHASPNHCKQHTNQQQRRFEDHTLRIWEKHGIKQVGFW